MQSSALWRSRRELSNEYFLAKFRFDTAENEPFKVCRSLPAGAAARSRRPRRRELQRAQPIQQRVAPFVHPGIPSDPYERIQGKREQKRNAIMRGFVTQDRAFQNLKFFHFSYDEHGSSEEGDMDEPRDGACHRRVFRRLLHCSRGAERGGKLLSKSRRPGELSEN